MAPQCPDYLVVGAGIIGLSIARELLLREPQATLVVIDKETDVGMHASGRNSGVLHAGFYYSPDSLKAQLTRVGNQRLREFCAEKHVVVRPCGKVVVTTAGDQLSALDELHARGLSNRVELEMIDEDQLHDLEPRARTVERALWSPTTAVADPVAVTRAMAEDVVRRGAQLRLAETALRAEAGALVTNVGTWAPGHLVNAAGLHADTVARWYGFCAEYALIPFKGLYWHGSWPPGTLTRHVYPVPDPRNPFLGVHLTVTVDGHCKIGPTAIPALRREDYGRWPGVRSREAAETVRQLVGIVRGRQHDVRSLIQSELPKYRQSEMVRRAQAMVPSVTPAMFPTRGRPGIRAQLVHRPSRRLEMDFVVEGDQRSTHVLNAVSPAWTSSIAFAEHVVDRLGRFGGSA